MSKVKFRQLILQAQKSEHRISETDYREMVAEVKAMAQEGSIKATRIA